MTTLYLSDKKCLQCGNSNKYPLIDLTLSISGVRDLDGRPSHIQRSLVYLWIQHCINCDYCAPDISCGETSYGDLIKTPGYLALLSNLSYPDTARSFLAYGRLMEMTEEFADAGWASLCAAWICDDNKYLEGAYQCRKKATELFSIAINKGQVFGKDRLQEKTYLIDIYRRIKDFNKARILCLEEIDKDYPDLIIDILYYEKHLIDLQDSDCHNENEAEEYEG
jgi:hypothetical protein